MAVSAVVHRLVKACEQGMRACGVRESEAVLLAVSGGMDSTCMLDMVSKFAQRMNLTVGVAHFNHQLRGDKIAQAESDVIARTCADHGFSFLTDTCDVRQFASDSKLSLELAARQCRYEFFARSAGTTYRFVATAHTADDNTETILMNLMRGTGLTGLCGIRIRRPLFDNSHVDVIRPLLHITRSDIESYAMDANVSYMTDASNADESFTRNRVRASLIPIIKSFNPEIHEALVRTSGMLRDVDEFLSAAVADAYASVIAREGALNIDRLLAQPRIIQTEIVLRFIGGSASNISTHAVVDAILALTQNQTGASVDIAASVRCVRVDNVLMLVTEVEDLFDVPIQIGETIHFGDRTVATSLLDVVDQHTLRSNDAQFLDADKLTSQQLLVRPWRDGDKFMPLGMRNEKKLSDFFVDTKVPAHMKSRVPLIVDADNIVCVCGMRIDERFKITPDTRTILRITCQ